MNIKILSSLKNVANEQSTTITIGTHNGIFHSDEVLACAILCLTYSKATIHILRSRDNEILQHCNIDYIFKSFDDSIIVPIDCEDNGVTVENHTFSFIFSFLPLWFNNIFCYLT